MEIENLLQNYDKAIQDEHTRKGEITEFQLDVQSHLEAVRQVAFDSDKVVNDLQVAKQRLEAEKVNLEQREKTAQQSAEDYFDGVSIVRTALAGGGPLESQLTGRRNDIINILSVNETDLDTILNEIAQYDNDTQKIEDDAVTALKAAQSDYDSASKTFDEKGEILNKAQESLLNLVQNAQQEKKKAEEDIHSIAKSIAENKEFETVVFYFDLKARMDALTSNVDLSKPHFNADNTDENALTDSLKAAWSTAKDEYVAALKALHEKNMTLIRRHSELAQANADVFKRKANRLELAAKMAEEKYSEIAPVITSP